MRFLSLPGLQSELTLIEYNFALHNFSFLRYFFFFSPTNYVMQPKRSHPFFSRFGCGTAILLAVVLGLVLYFRGGGPFSPGALTAEANGDLIRNFFNHAAFEQQCELCHAPWRGPVAERCEQCHQAVAEQRLSESGLHGLLPDASQCQRCHTDHKGKEAKITHLPPHAFEHSLMTDFSLAQHGVDYAGIPLLCAACHIDGDYTIAAIDCAGCHRQADADFMTDHTILFGSDCLVCHDGVDRMANFDHNLIFVLDGAHAQADCQGCHSNQLFSGTATDCANCHDEPAIHAGIFGLDCVRCHATSAWLPAQLTQHTFPLDHGEEGIIACETCHQQTYVEYTCYNCHAHDPVETRQKHIEEGITDFADCVACHPTGLKDEAEGFEND